MISAPATGRFRVGVPITIEWSIRNLYPGWRVSLCYDEDPHWDNGTEHWIAIDTIPAEHTQGRYRWDTRGMTPGVYYIGGYLHDGHDQWALSHLTTSIELVTQ